MSDITATKTLRIAAANADNFDELLDLIEDYQRFYEVKDIQRERNRRFFRRFLEHPEEGLQFVAYRGDQAVGFTTLYFPYSSTQARAFALMNDLFVTAGVRGEGVGLALIEKAREVAKARGYNKLSWMTAQDNHIAQRLYDRLEVEKSAWFEYSLPTGNDE